MRQLIMARVFKSLIIIQQAAVIISFAPESHFATPYSLRCQGELGPGEKRSAGERRRRVSFQFPAYQLAARSSDRAQPQPASPTGGLQRGFQYEPLDNAGRRSEPSSSSAGSDASSLKPPPRGSRERNPSYTSEADDPLYSPPSFLRSSSVTPNQARALLVVVAAVYGTNFGCVKLLQEALPPSMIMAARFSIATALLIPLAVATRPNKSLMMPFLAGAETGLWCIFAFTAQAVSLETTSAGTSAFICALCVLFVPFLDLLKGEPPPRRAVVAALGAAFGVALLELGPGTEPLTQNDYLSLLQPIFFGLGFWRMETFGRLYPKDALPLTAGQVAAVATFALAWALGDAMSLGGFHYQGLFHQAVDVGAVGRGGGGGLLLGPIRDSLAGAGQAASIGLNQLWGDVQASEAGTAVVVGTLLWTGIASTTITGLGETVALTKLTAAEATLIFSTEPLWGAAFAYAVLGEKLGPSGLAGGGIIVGACLWNALARAAEEKQEEKTPQE